MYFASPLSCVLIRGFPYDRDKTPLVTSRLSFSQHTFSQAETHHANLPHKSLTLHLKIRLCRGRVIVACCGIALRTTPVCGRVEGGCA